MEFLRENRPVLQKTTEQTGISQKRRLFPGFEDQAARDGHIPAAAREYDLARRKADLFNIDNSDPDERKDT